MDGHLLSVDAREFDAPMKRRAEILAWIGTRIGKPPGFERLVRLLMPPARCGDDGEICLLRDGSLFITRLTFTIGWHVAFFGSYEPELRSIVRAVLPTGGVALDVGANVGWHTLLMANLVGPQGRVLAVEANPSVRQELVRNIRLNRLAQVNVIPCAVAESERLLEFCAPTADDPSSDSGHVLTGAKEGADMIRVEARTLDAIASELRIDRLDLLKIDVEGFEWPALQGAERTIAKYRPYILFEFDAAYCDRGGGKPSVICDFFRRHEYRVFSVGRTWAEAVEPSRWPDCANLLAVPLE
jgi:FkbM family methyltransferase